MPEHTRAILIATSDIAHAPTDVGSIDTVPSIGTVPSDHASRSAETVTTRLIRQLGDPIDVVVLARPEVAKAFRLPVRVSASAATDLAHLAELTATAPGRVVIADAGVVANDSVIGGLVAGSGIVTLLDSAGAGSAGAGSGGSAAAGAALAGPGPAGRGASVRVDRGVVTSAGSAWHDVTGPTATAAGLLRVAASSAPAAAASLAAAAAAATDDGPTIGAAPDSGFALAQVALVRAGLGVVGRPTIGLVCAPVGDRERLRAAIEAADGVDEDAVRLRNSVKSDDDLFATYAVSSWSPRLVVIAARLGLSPAAVTWLSVLVTVVAAAGFAQAGFVATFIGAILLYLGFVLDCVDGQLARYTRQFSPYGGWLDTIADRAKEYLAYAGLAIGAARTGETGVWALAIAAITLQTVRHMTDCWYGAARDSVAARLAPAPFVDRADRSARTRSTADVSAGAADRLIAATNSGRKGVLHWVKKLLAFPIGERWLLISVGAVIGGGRLVFLAMLAWGLLAAAYTLPVRVWRSLALRPSVLPRGEVASHRDDGVLARLFASFGRGRVPALTGAVTAAAVAAVFVVVAGFAAGLTGFASALLTGFAAVAVVVALVFAAFGGGAIHSGPLDWLVPAALRLAEFLTVIGVGMAAGVPPPWIFAYVGVAGLYHYDLAARLDKGSSPIRWRAADLGWDGRLLVIGVAAVVGLAAAGAATVGVAGLTVYLFVAFASSASISAISAANSA